MGILKLQELVAVHSLVSGAGMISAGLKHSSFPEKLTSTYAIGVSIPPSGAMRYMKHRMGTHRT